MKTRGYACGPTDELGHKAVENPVRVHAFILWLSSSLS